MGAVSYVQRDRLKPRCRFFGWGHFLDLPTSILRLHGGWRVADRRAQYLGPRSS